MGRKKTAVAVRKRRDAAFAYMYQPVLHPQATNLSATAIIQWMLERKLLEISMNRFEWKGMPPEIDLRWLELTLNFYGLNVFFKASPDMQVGDKYLALRASQSGQLNMTGNPLEFQVFGTNTFQAKVKAEDCVPIWSNYMRTPDWDIITTYSNRIANMDRTIEINAKQQRTPKILKTTPNTRLSVVNFARQMDEGVAMIETDASTIDLDKSIDVLDLSVDKDAILNMHILRTREWSECMTFLGINNSNQDKKERLTAAETAGNDDVIATIRATNLKARKIACDQINEMFKLNVSVDYVTDMKTATLKDTGAPNDDPEEE